MKEKSKAASWKRKQEEEKKNSHKFVHPAHAFTSIRRSSQFPYDWSFSGFYSLGSPRLARTFFFIRNAPNVFPRIVLLQLESLTLFLFSRFSAYRVSCFTRRDCQDGSVEPATEDTKKSIDRRNDFLDSVNRSRRQLSAINGSCWLTNKSAVGTRCFKCWQWQLIDFPGTKLDDRSSWFVWCSWLNELMALQVTDPFFRSSAVHSNCMCLLYRPTLVHVVQGFVREMSVIVFPLLVVQNQRNSRSFEMKFHDF